MKSSFFHCIDTVVSIMVSSSSHAEEHEFYAFKFWQDIVHGHSPEAFRKTNGHSRLSVMILLPFKTKNRRHRRQTQKYTLVKPKFFHDFGQSIMDFGEISFGPLDG